MLLCRLAGCGEVIANVLLVNQTLTSLSLGSVISTMPQTAQNFS